MFFVYIHIYIINKVYQVRFKQNIIKQYIAKYIAIFFYYIVYYIVSYEL